MAPRGAVKARDFHYSNVGKEGRRTGITLKEGKRDEYGMEKIEGIFSSPERSPVKPNGLNAANETIVGSEGMSMDEGSAPGPADFLRRLSSQRGPHFPPVARSPMKTGLTGSPRRTPGVRSSSTTGNSPLSSSPTSNRQQRNANAIDLGKETVLHDHRPSTSSPTTTTTQGLRNKPKQKGVPFNLDQTAEFSDGDENSLLNGDDNTQFAGAQIDPVDDFTLETNDYQNFQNSDDSESDAAHPNAEDHDQDLAQPDSPSILASNMRKGRQKSTAPKLNEGPRKVKKNANASASTSKRKRPVQSSVAHDDAGVDVVERPPPKRTKTSESNNRDPDVVADPELENAIRNYANRTGPLKGRSLYILKREIPSDEKTTHTRSGRASVRPLAYWRNERCVYGDGEAEVGQRFPLTTIKEIIRTEEPEPEKKTGKRKTSSKKSRARKGRGNESEDESDHADPWEMEGGVLHGYVRKWDPETQTSTEEEEVLDIAYAPSGIETRDVKDSTFRFAKLLSSPFLGSGIVEIPPGGVKRPKNSKKMHMVFYVCHGRVQVDISGVQFSAGKGCVFQVPRGNYYSFANIHDKDAHLFFTQGCVPAEVDTLAVAKPDTEPETSAKEPRAGTGIKGRSRGRQRG